MFTLKDVFKVWSISVEKSIYILNELIASNLICIYGHIHFIILSKSIYDFVLSFFTFLFVQIKAKKSVGQGERLHVLLAQSSEYLNRLRCDLPVPDATVIVHNA